MKEPRFKKGQVVVVISTMQKRNRGLIGHVGTVERINDGPLGWGYNISGTGTGSDLGVHESCLRPYDPPADWTDDDMVWVPDALKDTEAV